LGLKVILKQDVKGLGLKEAVVEVAEGYARNYLIPRDLAVEASEGRMRELTLRKQVEKSKKDRVQEAAMRLAERLEGKEVLVKMHSGDGGKLFGSVTTREVAEVLARDYGIKIDRKQIELKETIKSLGKFILTARLYPGIQAKFTLVVTAD
jgi:large subunit ribosomal protein L9